MRDRRWLLTVAVIVVGVVVALGVPRGRLGAQDASLAAAVVAGDCARPGAVAWPLRDLAVSEGGALTSFTWIDVPIDELVGGGYAILVSRAGEARACGEIAGDGEDLFVALTARSPDGYGGIAWLSAQDAETSVNLFVATGLGTVGETGGGGGPPDPPQPPDDPPPTEEPVPPTPTPVPAEPDAPCAGVEEWLAATRPRLDRYEGILEEAATLVGVRADALYPTWEAWAAELDAFARDQAGAAAPAEAASINADLVAVFGTNADLLRDLVAAFRGGDANEVIRVQRAFQEIDVTYRLVMTRLRELGRDCGFTL